MSANKIETNTLRESSIVDLFREQVALNPLGVAVTSDGLSVTYAQLHRSCADIAAFLNGIGVAADMPVGIFAEPSVDLVAGIWGVLLAGAAYLPLAPDYPEARLSYMIENSGVRVILCQEKLRSALTELAPAGVRIVSIGDTVGADTSQFRASPVPTDLAYLIYTSGSTGRPKGVMVEHRGIANQMRWLRDRCGIGPGGVVLQKTPVSFDAAQWEILSVCCGSRVVIGGPGCYRDPERLIAIIREHGATKLQCVPTLLQALLDTDGFDACTSLATIFSGGEMLSRKLAEQCCAALPGCDLVNFYGPTECTINASAYFVDRATLGEAPSAMPIGRAVDNTELLILDETGAPAPVGQIGELFIGGVQVARGYFARPDLTSERFVAPPLAAAGTQARIYNTGDLAHWNADGTVQFVGRADNQIKLRGFRVELDEIRTVIETHDWVKTAAVLVKESPRTGFQNLIACIELSPREAALMDQGSHGSHHVSKSNKLQVKAQLSGAGCRDASSLTDETPVVLPGRTPIETQSRMAFARKTYRFFEGGEVTRSDLLRLFERPATSATPRDPASLSLAELGEILRYFGPFESAERLLPKYTYASPGALYAAQLYLEVRNLAGLADGFHYFHPLQHRLYAIAGAVSGEDAAAPRLALHFVGKTGAIEPVYKTNIEEVLEFEAGHMPGVFDRVLPRYGLAIAQARRDSGLRDLLVSAPEDHYLGGFEIAAAPADPADRTTDAHFVDLRVDAHPGKIPDLPGGQYLYRDGALERVSDDIVQKKHVIAINQQVYEQASFGVTMISRGAPEWLRYISLGRALQHLQMNDLNLGLMSSGYSSRNGQDLPSARRIARILGHEPDASYFAVGGRVSDAQIVSRGMKEDSVHMMGPAELIREDIKSLLPDYMMPNKIVLLDRLPLSSSGKVDVIALRSYDALDLDIVDRPVIPPRTPTEERIGAIWGELLRHESISIQDDFFETGGNSLIAVALINKINRTFGCALSLQILFDCPTIEQLAECVESADTGVASRFVRLTNGAPDKPVFCWPGLGGYPMSLRTLAGEIGLDRQIYGVQAYGINPGEEPFDTVAEMAAEDIRAIRRIQPRGPYSLWGYSFGARLAFETAYQLEQAGDVVEDLFLIAPGSPKLDIEDPKGVLAGGDPGFSRAFVTILFSVFGRSISGAMCNACLAAARDEDSFVAFICEHFPQLETDQVRRITRIVRLTYQPEYTFDELVGRSVCAQVTIFKARGDDYSFLETCSGFTRRQPDVIALATDHYSLLKAPHLRELVWQIRHRIRMGAQAAETAVPLERTAD